MILILVDRDLRLLIVIHWLLFFGIVDVLRGIFARTRFGQLCDPSRGIENPLVSYQSPDLSPIEHLWAYLKRKIASYQEVPEGMMELWERVSEEWRAIAPETCQTLIESMPKRGCLLRIV